jgi:CCR4-NOT transcription complex subunit 10
LQGSKDDSADAIGEENSAALMYNVAASYYREEKYAQAGAILKALFSNIEPVEEGISMHICFLLLDVLLHANCGNLHSEEERARMVRQTQSIISFLEKPHSFNGQVGAPPADAADEDGKAATAKKADSPGVAEFRLRLHVYKAKVCLLELNVKVAKKELKSALELSQKAAGQRKAAAAGGPAAAGANGIMVPPVTMQNPAALYLKANLEYLRQNYRKSIKLLQSADAASLEAKQNHQRLFLNNMGCMHYREGCYRSAASYFSRALQAPVAGFDEKTVAAETTPVVGSLVVTSNECEVLYNSGLQLLLMGRRPAAAFKCFTRAACLMHNRPRLWVRMGECCIAAHAEQRKSEGASDGGLVRGLVGANERRRVLLPPSGLAQAAAAATAPAGANGEKGEAQLTLRYAVKCFRNVLSLTANYSGDTGVAGGKAAFSADAAKPAAAAAAAAGGDDSAGGAANAGENGAAVRKLRMAAHSSLAYVSLCTNNPLMAHTHAEQLLAMTDVPAPLQYLGHSYAAEALCLLSRPAEALHHLAPHGGAAHGEAAVAAAVKAKRPDQAAPGAASRDAPLPGGQTQQQVSAQARSDMQVNLANVYVLQNDLAEAEKCVQQALQIFPSSSKAARLLVYICLRKGRTADALKALKERRA